MTAVAFELLDQGKALRIDWSAGARARFHALWLRDNALDEASRSPANGQRLISVLDVPPDVRIEHAWLTRAGEVALRFAPGGYETVFPAAWLLARRYDVATRCDAGWISPDLDLWDASASGHLPTADLADIQADRAALGRWLGAVRRFGVAMLHGVPCRSGALCAVAELFGFVRETNYGRWFEVRAEVNPTNLAYTNLGLEAHTDNPYRDPVPTLQLLACLDNTVEGGESRVVDGFAIAHRLRAEDQDGFALLARHPARFDYAGSSGVRLASKRPMLELGPDGELLAVRFNNRSAAPLVDVPYDDMPAYYAAYRRFAELAEDPAMGVEFRLAPGSLFIVDNTRVLHARTAFSGSGSRWLQGCYADKDGLLSTLAAIEHESLEDTAR